MGSNPTVTAMRTPAEAGVFAFCDNGDSGGDQWRGGAQDCDDQDMSDLSSSPDGTGPATADLASAHPVTTQPAAPEGDLTQPEPAPEPPGRRRRGRAWPWAAGIMIGILTLAVGAGGYVIAVQAQAIEQLRDVQGNAFRTLGALDDRVERVTGQQEQSAEDRMDVAAVYDRAVRSVLTVFCGDGQGTGFAYEATPRKGYKSIIVTNYHVIEQCTYDGERDITLMTSEGEELRGYVWNWDERNDLSLIYAKRDLPTLRDADEPKIGDPVIAVGSPQGLANSVTLGIVSNIYDDAVQTDAAINHGNSGGPLLDRFGGLLGVTTLGLDREGLNIAVHTRLFCEGILRCD